MTYRIAVLGGGAAGVTVAGQLAKIAGIHVDLFERSERLGGLHHSPVVGGLAYDIGAFLFDPSHPLLDTFPELRRIFVPVTARMMSMRDGGHLDEFPLTLGGYSRSHSVAHLIKALADLLASKVVHRRKADLRSYLRYYLGGTIYEHSGLRAYVERLFASPDTEIDLLFAQQRMGDMSERASFRVLLSRLARHPVQSLSNPRQASALARPPGGFQRVYSAVESALSEAGVGVRKGIAVTSISRDKNCFWLESDGRKEAYDRVVSTIPLPILGRLLKVPLDYAFQTVTLLSLFYRCKGPHRFDSAILFNYSRTGNWKRITDFSLFYGDADGDNYFAVEIPLPSSQSVDVITAAQAFEAHVAGSDLFSGQPIFQGHSIVPNAYPVFKSEGLGKLAADKARVAETGVVLLGRQGEFRYVSSHTAAESAVHLARKLGLDAKRCII